MLATPARADLQLCNRTSYVVEAAIGIEDKGAAATRGWFRLDPGQCRPVMQGKVEAERVYVHARALDVYGVSPMAQSGHAELCIAEDAFLIAGARHCTGRGQRLVRFTEVKPSETSDGLTASLAEEADYEPAQARLAGIQRLLVAAGYDANPIDGLEGKKTEAALSQFLKDRRLAPEAANRRGFFDTLVASLKQADGVGFAWCNETTAHRDGGVRHRGEGRHGHARLVPHRARPMRQAGRCRQAAPPLQLRRSGRRRRAGGPARRQAARLGRDDAVVHPQREVRDQRSQGLRRQGPHGLGIRTRRPRRPDRRHRAVPRMTKPDARSFGHVETWVFDLDNTLYPHHLNLWQQVDERIRDYIARFLDITHDEAFRLQKDYYRRYGTSMRGLMTEHGMSPTHSSTSCTRSTTPR